MQFKGLKSPSCAASAESKLRGHGAKMGPN
jgi:hypothetical protein